MTPKVHRSWRARVLRQLLFWPPARRVLLPLAEAIQRTDAMMRTTYQPVDELGIEVDRATRERIDGRWLAIAPVLQEVDARSALDIGAAEGYYSLRIARRGIPVIALEAKEGPFDLLARAVRLAGLTNLGQLRLSVTPETVESLPSADAVLLLAVWHHWVRVLGLDVANSMLDRVWQRTHRVLFFETGENMPDHYGLPSLGDDPERALVEFLNGACVGGEVRLLGRFPDRHLFAVVRSDSAMGGIH